MFDAVILAGGRAERLGGVDKPGLEVGGTPMIGNVAAAARGADRIVIVGPPRDIPGAIFVREDPPGAGPVPALRAGLAEVTAPWVILLAGDLPFLASSHLAALLAHTADQEPPGQLNTPTEQAATLPPAETRRVPGASTRAGEPTPGPARAGTGAEPGSGGTPAGRARGVVAVDAEGREQWLLGVWEVAGLREALDAYEGRSLRGLLGPLVGRRVPLPRQAWFDCDTGDDLKEARNERAG